jgi:hypothetical protein
MPPAARRTCRGSEHRFTQVLTQLRDPRLSSSVLVGYPWPFPDLEPVNAVHDTSAPIQPDIPPI